MFTKITLAVPNWLDRICTWPVTTYRRLKYGYPFRRIYLDDGLWTIVDPQDYYRYGCFKWCFDGHDGKFYAVRNTRVGLDYTRRVRLSREIMKAPKKTFVDHRNGDSLDNRKANLRIATRCQNMQNAKKRKKKAGATSQFTGVYLDKNGRIWNYQLKANGKIVSTGRFPTEIEAARARDIAAIKYHGEFAKLNFPKEIERSPKRLNLRLANWLGARLNFPRGDYINENRPLDSK